MSDSEAGPSTCKKRKLTFKNPKKLTEEELLQAAEAFGSDFEDSSDSYIPDGGESTSDEDLEDDATMDEDGMNDPFEVLGENAQQGAKDLGWVTDNKSMNSFEFNKNTGLLTPIDPDATPYEYFRLLVDDCFLQNIVNETNRNAEEIFLSKGTTAKSRITKWNSLTIAELLTFIGLLFHMGTIKCNKIQDYWKTYWLFSFGSFSKYMGRDRFLMILRCLHFSKNADVGEEEPFDRLYKIRPVINYFQTKMTSLYYPTENLSLDESMILWRGRLAFRQYIKNKLHKYGIKLYILSEPEGLVLNMAVYTGQLDEIGGKGHTDKVVMHLLENFVNSGHSIYMDNFYNSYGLALKLLEKMTYCTGTLRPNRKDSAKEVILSKLNKGETTAAYRNGVMIGKWKDKREVTYISTEHCNDLVQVKSKRGIETEKPLPIVKYNQNMSGIDRFDQMMSYYPCSRKTMRWYKKVAIHVLQMLLHNSFHLYNKFSGKRLSFYDFRLAVLEKILPEHGIKVSKPIKIAADHLP